jgi:hypothetical protein
VVQSTFNNKLVLNQRFKRGHEKRVAQQALQIVSESGGLLSKVWSVKLTFWKLPELRSGVLVSSLAFHVIVLDVWFSMLGRDFGPSFGDVYKAILQASNMLTTSALHESQLMFDCYPGHNKITVHHSPLVVTAILTTQWL